MNKPGISFESVRTELMQDEEFKKEYERLQLRYEVISQLIDARKEQNLSQAELAKRVGTQKSNISRLESGNYNPTLDMLVRVANSMGLKVNISFEENM